MKNLPMLFALLLLHFCSNAQSLLEQAQALEQAKKHAEAAALYQQLADQAQAQNNWEEMAAKALKANEMIGKKIIPEKIPALLKTINPVFEQVLAKLGETHEQTGWWYVLLSKLNRRINNTQKGKEQLDKGLEILKNIIKDNHPKAIDFYLELSSDAFQKTAHNEAAMFAQQAYQLAQQQYAKDDERWIPLLLHYALFAEGFKASIDIMQQAEAIADKHYHTAQDDIVWANIYMRYGYFYSTQLLEQFQKAEESYKRAAAVAEKNREFRLVGSAWQNLGVLYKDSRNHLTEPEKKKQFFERSQRYAILALEAFERSYIKANNNIAMTCYNQGFLLFYEGHDVEKVLSLFHRGLSALANDKLPEDIYYIPDTNNIPFFTDKHIAARLMRGKNDIFEHLFKQTKEEKYRQMELHGIRVCELLYMDWERETTKYEDKGIILGLLNNTLVRKPMIYWQAYLDHKDPRYLDLMFQSADMSKSVFLVRSLQSKDNQRIGGLPDAIAQEEEAIRTEAEAISKKLAESLALHDSAQIAANLSAQITNNTKSKNFTKKLREQYPKYFELSHYTRGISLAAFQKTLDEKTAFLHFFRNGYSFTAMVITKDSAKLHLLSTRKELGLTDRDNPPIKELQKALSNHLAINIDPQQAYKDYVKAAYSCYYNMFLDEILPKNVDRLIISPDEHTNGIPFEALLVTMPDTNATPEYNKLDYLLHHYTIQYAYSATLYAENLKQHRTGKGKIAAFAASYGAVPNNTPNRNEQQIKLREILAELPGARNEIQQLQQAYGGDYFFDTLASEKQFKSLPFHEYGVVHLAMHGLLNKNQALLSSLAFTDNGNPDEDNFLYFNELSNMSIPANLVVLSACETGIGKEQSGEGTMSIARSFMYAGVPALVMTLWEVNDNSMSMLMQDFYKNLADGKPKDQALRLAKLSYLQKAKGNSGHPFYWAGPTLLGNPEPIPIGKNESTWLVWWLTGGSGLFVIALIAIGKRRKK